MQSISANLNIMIKAAEKASRALIRDFGEIEKLQVSIKGPTDFVSNADLKAEKIIIEELKKARPYYSIISEEDGSETNKDKEHTWIIDPIDGTTNFLHGVPTAIYQPGSIRALAITLSCRTPLYHRHDLAVPAGFDGQTTEDLAATAQGQPDF